MGDHNDWKDLPIELLRVITQKLNFLIDVPRFSAVCKSWNSAASELKNDEMPWRPSKYPWLLLAEDTGLDLSAVKFTLLQLIRIEEHYDYNDGHDFGDDETTEIDRIIDTSVADLFKNISSNRGLFSLATQKIYNLDLPEATDKLILGTNKGWLVTLGRDLEINLLHPILRHQIPLPPMLILPSEYHDDFPPHKVYDRFIIKVVMSSEVPRKSALQHHDTSELPVILVIHQLGFLLGFARLGDKLWTNVELETSTTFHDIVYHKEKFYAINFRGTIYKCDIGSDDIQERQHKGTIITSIPFEKKDWVQCYLIESLSGSHIWLALRFWESSMIPEELNYYTSKFSVYKLEIHYSSSDDEIPTCTWSEEVKELGNEALFIGRASSVSITSSEFIKPNSIYFTDDNCEGFGGGGGGHDMGIFNVETGKIEPHFQGLSIHGFSPPLWYM